MAFNMTKYVGDETLECVVSLPGTEETITVTYRPRAFSTEGMTRSEKAVIAGRELAGRDGLVDTVAALLAGWDVTDGDEPLPLTRESLENLPDVVLGHILEAVITDLPKASEKKPSI
jgi:hypothetical protein